MDLTEIVLIVGFPRSGTTLVRVALGAHPKFCVYPGEGSFLRRIEDCMMQRLVCKETAIKIIESLGIEFSESEITRGIKGAYEETKRCTLRLALLHVLKSRCANQEKPVVPLVKFGPLVQDLDRADRLFPEIKIIHVIRDPRGTIASHAARWPDGGLWYRITKWKQAITAGRKWGDAHKERYYELRYETLLQAPVRSLRSVCDFVGLKYDPAMARLDYVTWEFDTENLGAKSKRHFTRFDSSKIDQWREGLAPREIHLIESRCDEEMHLFEYEPVSPDRLAFQSSVYRAWERLRYFLSQIRQRLFG